MNRTTLFGPLDSVCRLGLATRGESALTTDDIRHTIDRGINYLKLNQLDFRVSS